MTLDKARDALGRAERMLKDLAIRAGGSDEQAFEDRLPYVLDLLTGVRRQIDSAVRRSPEAKPWWATQKTQERVAIDDLRHAHLKRLERRENRNVFLQTFSSQGAYNGKTINSGDSVAWWEWRFIDGQFAGENVMNVLWSQLVDLEALVTEAESRLS